MEKSEAIQWLIKQGSSPADALFWSELYSLAERKGRFLAGAFTCEAEHTTEAFFVGPGVLEEEGYDRLPLKGIFGSLLQLMGILLDKMPDSDRADCLLSMLLSTGGANPLLDR